MRNGVPVAKASARAERTICPPPSPCAPSMVSMVLSWPSFPAASLAVGRRAIRRPAARADPTQEIHYTRRVPKARDKACVTDEGLRFTAEVPVEVIDLPAPRLAGPDAPEVRRAHESIASRMR